MFMIIVITCLMLIPTDAKVKRTPWSKHLRVLDGRDIMPGEYPFAVTLMDIFKDEYGREFAFRGCTASVIAKHWTLSASHCVNLKINKDFYVWYGNFTDSPLVTKLYSKVLKIFMHPSFRIFESDSIFNMDNDICLLRTEKVNVEVYGTLSAVDHTTLIGLPVTYVGGGGTNKPGDDQLRPLQVGEGAIITCDKEFKDTFRYLICITPKCSNRLHMGWYGDSGGPLVQDSKIIGVYALVLQDGNMAFMGYTPVNSNIDWILNVMLSKY